MAEGFAKRFAPPDVLVMSAGSQPQPRGVHPMAIAVVQEIGISLEGHHSKHVDDVPWQKADTIVTLCGEDAESCPSADPSVRRVHWALPDPSLVPESERLAAFREMREEIRWRVASLWPRGE